MDDKPLPDTPQTEAGAPDAMQASEVYNTLREALEAARSKLLDRSLRNKLIHTNVGSTTARQVRIIDEKSAEVFRLLTGGKSLTFSSAKGRAEDDGRGDEGVYVPLSDDADQGTAARHLDQKLQTRLTPEGLQKKLLSLFYEGQTLEEEQGINVLYLALGFLEWREARQSDVPRFAPLVLMPVELLRDGSRDRFKLRLRPEDLLTNFSLQAWLKEQFALELPDLSEADELDVGSYFAAVRALVEARKNWQVHEDEIILGFFSFSKFLLWRDLDPANWPKAEHLTANLILSRILLRDREDSGEIDDAPLITDDERLDDVFRPADLVHITDADSSQAIAIQEALSGKNLVIQGPPGTGKSQTITNLIAGAVKRGKRVLFIAEKMAALDVVHSRLVKAKLGSVCLELHSRKAAKTQVLEQIKQGMAAAVPPAWSDKAFTELEASQSALRGHTDRLHANGPNGLNPYQLMGKIARLKRLHTPTPDFTLAVATDWTSEVAETYALRVKQLAERLVLAGIPAHHPWRGASIDTPDLLSQDRLRPLVNRFADCSEHARNLVDKAVELLDVEEGPSIEECRLWCAALEHLAARPAGVDDWLASDEVAKQLAEIEALVGAGERAAALRPIVSAFELLFDHLCPGAPPPNLDAAWALLASRPKGADALLLDANFAENRAELALHSASARRLYELRASLTAQVIPDAFEGDWLDARKAVAAHGQSFIRWLSHDYRRSIVALRGVCVGSLSKAHSDRLGLLDHLIEVKRLAEEVRSRASLAKVWGPIWRYEQTDWGRVQAVLHWVECAKAFEPQLSLRNPESFALSDQSGTWPDSTVERGELISNLVQARHLRIEIAARANEQRLLGDLWLGDDTDWALLKSLVLWINGARRFEPSIRLRRAIVLSHADDAGGLATQLSEAVVEAKVAYEAVRAGFVLDETIALPGVPLGNLTASDLHGFAAFWRSSFARITEWPPIREDLRWLNEIGCGELAARVFDGRISAPDLENMFLIAAYEAMWTRTRQGVPEVENTVGDQLSAYVARFRAADLDRIRIAADEVSRAHTDLRPTGSAGAVGILKDETKKSRKLKPVRRLMEEAGEAIQRFKPVMLMSPLSVAQYLPPGRVEFDLCVIDEASQVRPEDALGAIARCRQVVVVGDDKQLPPTSFFNRMVNDDDPVDEDEVVSSQRVRAAAVKDVESILNLCSRFPERMLRWHYRSEHPSLIATSNRNFYKDQLMLPPSVVARAGDGETGLLFHKVREGGYERGKTARNEIEAEAVAQAALRHARASPNFSLGIGTFSVAQRDAIRDRLEHLAAHNPELDTFLRKGAKDEPVFVKNLENIQGDERDVIFISVGYGRDQDGRLTQQFGPVGREGGERRLNVLITRARKRCEVFSSLVAEDIKSDGAPKPGVAALKEFLKLAKDGYADLAGATGRGFDSDFEESVALAIRELGYEVHPQVGMSGFFVDLGVLDPGNRDRYLMGVECDGAAYHSSSYSRDRDRLRQHILETRGWRIHRIWSTDWFYRQDREIEKLRAALETALQGKSLPRADEVFTPEPISEPTTEDGIDPTILEPAGEVAGRLGLTPYIVSNCRAPERKHSQPHQLWPARLAEIVTEIVEVEQPIHEEEVARRLAGAFDLQRAGSRIQEAALDGLRAAAGNKILAQKGKFWRMAHATNLLARDRSLLPPAATVRKPEYICPTEVAQAVREVLRQSLALEADELVIETARMLGFARTGPDVAAVIKNAIKSELKAEVDVDHLGRMKLRGE